MLAPFFTHQLVTILPDSMVFNVSGIHTRPIFGRHTDFEVEVSLVGQGTSEQT